MAHYGKFDFWEDRYQKDPEPFDWYQRWAGIADVIHTHIPNKNAKVLNVGCGNSRLSEEMIDDLYASIDNIDFSKIVIDTMTERCKDKTGLKFQVMNVMEMTFPDGSYDAVIDKGTLDSILCGDNSTSNAARYCSHVSRILRDNGVFIIISYGLPENRLSYLDNEDYKWKVTTQTIPKPMVSSTAQADKDSNTAVHYIYICTKTN